MRKAVFTLAIAFSFITMSYAQDTNEEVQENIATHNTAMGETVLIIAKKYKITPRDIYDYNPDATEGISQNTVLRIPLHRQYKSKPVSTGTANYTDEMYGDTTPKAVVQTQEVKSTEVLTERTPAPEPVKVITEANTMQTLQHIVKSGETLFSLARLYNTTVKDIEKENPGKLSKGLETGVVLNITTIPRAGDPDKYIKHSVAKGETLFSLARKYNTSVTAITESNRTILKKGLMSGQQLLILPGVEDTSGTVKNNYEIAKTDVNSDNKVEHTVQNGETLMGLARKYNTTVDDITAINKGKVITGAGLQPGQVITIKNNSSALSTVAE